MPIYHRAAGGRPAVELKRLTRNGAGQVVYELKNPYRDGTTHVLFEPLDFMAKLAALVPRPRANLVRYHGIWHDRGHRMRSIAVRWCRGLDRIRDVDGGPVAAQDTRRQTGRQTGR